MKKPGSEIEEIFAGRKRKKSLTDETEKTNGDAIARSKEMKKKKNKGFKDEGLGDLPSLPRNKTQDGLLSTQKRNWVLITMPI